MPQHRHAKLIATRNMQKHASTMPRPFMTMRPDTRLLPDIQALCAAFRIGDAQVACASVPVPRAARRNLRERWRDAVPLRAF